MRTWRQGVAIGIFVKEPGKRGTARVHALRPDARHADLWGTRESKYEILSGSDVSTTGWSRLEPESPSYMFKPWDKELDEEYRRWSKITEVMPVNSVGVVTARDKLTIQHSPDEVMRVVRDFAGLPPETARGRYNLGRDAQDWKVQWAQDDLKGSGLNDDLVTPVLYRPLDTRYTYYTGESRGFICRPRSEVMRHMQAGENLGLCVGRAGHVIGSPIWDVLFCTANPTEFNLFRRGGNNLFPLYTYPSEQEIEQGLYSPGDREPNLSPTFVENLEKGLGLRFVNDGRGDLYETFGPEDVLHYIYAVFHSPTYRKRYDQLLRADFPRVPLTDDVELFRALAGLGGQLTGVHLMEAPSLNQAQVSFPVSGDNVIEKGHPKYYGSGDTPPSERSPVERGRTYISKNNPRSGKRGQYFDGIAPDVWEFRVGGYQPLDKWLKDRRGRTLSFDDLDHYRRIAAALRETVHLMEEIDCAIADSGLIVKSCIHAEV